MVVTARFDRLIPRFVDYPGYFTLNPIYHITCLQRCPLALFPHHIAGRRFPGCPVYYVPGCHGVVLFPHG